MKSFTDLEQSKKLAEILPLESADMLYWAGEYITHPYMEGQHKDEQIPIWSLAALLDVIPKRIKHYNILTIDVSDNEFAMWYEEIAYRVNSGLPNITKDNPIDACVELILKLHGLNLL